MSGFLERLIARHIDPAPVRPRVASRFEGRPGAVVPDVRHPETTGAASHVRGAPVQAEPVATFDAGTLDSTGGASTRSAALGPATARPGTAMSGINPPGGPTPGRVAVTGTPGRGTTGLPAGADDPTRAARDQAASRTTVPSPAATPAIVPGAVVAARKAPAATPGLLQPQLSSRRSAPAAAPVADVVHVHIGRVEVRAVMARAERPRESRSKATAALPLDRYLSGDRRR